MKIIKVSFENLNSLAGKWEIDFTDPVFSRSPLFAITGPTGSGKTTIMDAISLALYGKTARLNALTQSSNEIMTRGTAYCSADVVFEASGKTYLAHWKQWRANNSVDGNLQPIERRIHLGKSLKDDVICSGVIACDGLKNTIGKIEEITKLTFEQFSQSVMLSQGQFTKFLKADANERANLLERMTGTQIYSSISIKVNNIFKDKENQKKELNQKSTTLQGTLLQEDERKENEQWLEHADEDIKKIDARIDQLNKQKSWLEECDKQKKEADIIKNAIEEHESKNEAFAPDRQRLEQGERAQKHEISLKELHNVQKDLEISKTNLEQAEKNVTKLQKDIEDATESATLAKDALEQAEIANEEAQPRIEAMIGADTNINNLVRQIEAKQERVNASEHDLNDAQKQSEIDAREVKRIEDELQKVQVWLADHQLDSTLKEAYNEIKGHSEALKKSFKAMTKAQNKLQELQKEQQTYQDAYTSAQKSYQHALDLKTKADESYRTEESKYNALLNGKTKEELETERDQLKEDRVRIDFAKSLEEHRKGLREGEPCPLCGSLHHPWVESMPQNTDELSQKIENLDALLRKIKTSEKALNTAKEDQNKAELQLVQTNNEQETKHDQCEKTARQIEENNQDYAEKNQEYEADQKAFLDAVHIYAPDYVMKPNSGILERLEKRKDEYESHLINSQSLKDLSASAKETASKSEAAYTAAQDTCKSVQIELTSLQEEEIAMRKDRILRFGDEKPDALRRRLAADVKSKKSAKEQSDEHVRTTRKAFDENNQNILRWKESIQKLSDNIKERQDALLSACQKDDFESIEAISNAILDPQKLKALQNTRSQLMQEETTLNFRRAENNKKIEELTANPLTDKSLAEIIEALNEQNQRKVDINQTYGSKLEAIRKDDENRAKWNEAVKAEQAFLPEFTRWENLNNLIGSSDGKKFKVFVQNLTLKFLINYANDYLNKLDSRYKLIPVDYVENINVNDDKPDAVANENTSAEFSVMPINDVSSDQVNTAKPKRGRPKKANTKDSTPAANNTNKSKSENYRQILNFKLIDSDMNDIRPTTNLSGGETFLVSLSLALGLAAMASRNIRIDSLYIDEGFGTLDNETLSQTLQALCAFNGNGRQIGIISHVAALQEAITTKITVTKNGQTGHSTLDGAGVKRLN